MIWTQFRGWLASCWTGLGWVRCKFSAARISASTPSPIGRDPLCIATLLKIPIRLTVSALFQIINKLHTFGPDSYRHLGFNLVVQNWRYEHVGNLALYEYSLFAYSLLVAKIDKMTIYTYMNSSLGNSNWKTSNFKWIVKFQIKNLHLVFCVTKSNCDALLSPCCVIHWKLPVLTSLSCTWRLTAKYHAF